MLSKIEVQSASSLSLFLFILSYTTWQGCQSPAQDIAKERVEKYGSGEISRRYQEINGKKQGKMTDFYPGGRLKAERWFENDQQAGRTVLYYPGGQIMEVQYYQNGKKEGGDTVFYESGQPQFVMWYAGEKKNGYLRKWSSDGALVFEARYANDSLVEVKGQRIQPGSTTSEAK
ncbi:MAG: hypothetical protein IPH12_10965 [Saprospirales bacterium]|nr:hypothetical protein [Saprospirales bacterium]